MPSNILVVDKASDFRELIVFTLSRAGHALSEASDMRSAIERLDKVIPDLIVVGQSNTMPDGVELLKQLRLDEVTCEIPCIVLADNEQDRADSVGFRCGYDEWLVRPFALSALTDSVRRTVSRLAAVQQEMLRVRGIVLDLERRQARVEQHLLRLTPIEFRLLHFFLTHPNHAYLRSELLDHVWGRAADVSDRVVDVSVLRLRRALQPAGLDGCLKTARGIGYLFDTLD